MIQKTRLMIDGHVHIYDCYDLELFFQNAITNLDHYYNTDFASNTPYVRVLLLTEGKQNDFFTQWRENGVFANDSGFRFVGTKEETSLVLTKKGVPQCYLIRGRQIVTQDNLEILSVASNQIILDGLPSATVIDRLFEKGEPAVLAWGFGKWLFKRARVVQHLMNTFRSRYLLLGDNSGRPTFWSTPRLFKLGESRRMALTSGSDPLPFPTEINKVGTFGFSLEGDFDEYLPATSIRNLLTAQDVGARIQHFGTRDNTISFFKRQSKIYIKKYLKK